VHVFPLQFKFCSRHLLGQYSVSFQGLARLGRAGRKGRRRAEIDEAAPVSVTCS
jgi:hypothetical protein